MSPDAPASAPGPASRTIRVATPSREYDAVVGTGVLASLGDRARQAGLLPSACMVFADSGVPTASLDTAMSALRAAGFEPRIEPFAVSERAKSLTTLAAMLASLAAARHERTHPVIAIGGGILGDTAGFAAATYRRGVPWVNCPTTLLSMVDASVGGKTAVNLDLRGDLKKNMLGAFHQPALVLADVATLASLSDRTFRCGLAECVKHGLIAANFGDAGLLSWTQDHTDTILARHPATLVELIARNIAIKARVVAGDEREEASDEAGGRALLNLGHTFAHAIEPLPTLSPDADPTHAPLQHGEAVALGLVAACAAAAHPALALADADLGTRVRSMLKHFGLPITVRGLPGSDALLEAMAHDKKVASGRLRVVLPLSPPIGRARVVSDPPREAVLAGLAAIRV